MTDLQVEETCEGLGKLPNESINDFVLRLARFADQVQAENANVRQWLSINHGLDPDAPLPDNVRARSLGPIRPNGKSGALDAENQALELTHYVNGCVAINSAIPGGVLVDRNSWHKLRHRVDMLLGIPAPAPAPEPIQPPSQSTTEVRARLTECAVEAFRSTYKGNQTASDYAEATIRSVCWAVAQELSRKSPSPPEATAPAA